MRTRAPTSVRVGGMAVQGSEFGRYRLERLIGSGGMGDVYEAVDTERDRVVALKLLPELFGASAEFQERFRRESQIAARLRDPHIIPIHDYGEIDGRLYIDMRLVDNGATVATLLRDEGPMSPERAVGVVEQVCEALDAAHDDGLVHRDVKPSNVLVTTRDFVYVVDFGIAHVMGHTAYGLTGSGSTVGTLDYMAPERFAEKAADRRSDVYSLACLLYECLTARAPFEATTAPGLMYAHLHEEPPRAGDDRDTVPGALDEVVRTGMAKEPDDRYPSAGALGRAARAALRDDEDAAPTRLRLGPGAEPASAAITQPAPTATEPPDDDAAASQGPDEGPREPAPAAVAAESGTEVPDDPGAATVPAPATPAGPTPPAAADAPGGEPPTEPGLATTRRRRARRVAVVAGAALAAALAAVLVTLAVVPSAPNVASPPPVADGGLTQSVLDPRDLGPIPTGEQPGFVIVSQSGRFAYVTQRGPRRLAVVDLVTRRETRAIDMPSTPRFVTLSPDGTRALVSCYNEGDSDSLVAVVDLGSGAVLSRIPVDRQPWSLALAPDGRSLWVPSHATGTIDVVDIVTGTPIRQVRVAPNPHWIVFSGPTAWVVNHESNRVSVMDVATATVRREIAVGTSPHAAALSPNGSRLAVVNYDSDDLTIIDTATETVETSIPVGEGPQHVRWAPDGRHLYTADVDGDTVTVLDANSGSTRAIPVGPSPTSVALTPDGSTLVASVLGGAQLAVLGTGV